MTKKKIYQGYLPEDVLKALDGEETGLPESDDVFKTTIPPMDLVEERIDLGIPVLGDEEDIPDFIKDLKERRSEAPFSDESGIAEYAKTFVEDDDEERLGKRQPMPAQQAHDFTPPASTAETAGVKKTTSKPVPAKKKLGFRQLAGGALLSLLIAFAVMNIFPGDKSLAETAPTEETLTGVGGKAQEAQEAQPTAAEELNLGDGNGSEPVAEANSVLISLAYPCSADWDITYANPEYSMDRYNCMGIQFLNWLRPGAVTPTNWVNYLQNEQEFKDLYIEYLKGNDLSTLEVTQEMLIALGIQQ
ncbi:MAG: hypothetical protein HN846_03810 [Candidatus Pacebacteria bacterium]|jgi:hypothetical protein|nr:hypothetical protein [Candidatus Paceibacterota bacterium]MBT4639921.1 hypothetical protein [Deltaproteobacteria bacterium]MBT3511992.1 hypothetical protein [Candidatus Paceibacterota bacterium]MBT4005314.1 hypothetical protein [Candidatus Paceibacterota bacterium]MBT4358378.1 hypothetical protein [Candidatus Paceibacterota bacterium]